MATAALKPCRSPGCARFQTCEGYCEGHYRQYLRTRKLARSRARKRDTFSTKPRRPQGDREHQAFYDSAEWRKCRNAYYHRHPLCEHCDMDGRLTAAAHVDHIVSLKDGGAPLHHSNLQSLCVPCHNRKTRKEEGQRKAGEALLFWDQK